MKLVTVFHRFLRSSFTKCTNRTFTKIGILTSMMFSLYAFIMYIPDFQKEPRPMVHPFSKTLKFLRSNGAVHPDDLGVMEGMSHEEKLKAMLSLREGINQIFNECLISSKYDHCNSPQPNNDQPILTLFTTWIYDEEKFFINNNTLYNWRKLSGVNLVVFTNDAKVKDYSEKAGWLVLPIGTTVAGDAPVLKQMFHTVQQQFKTDFYGYSNGDLLFEEGLYKTLKKIACQMNETIHTKPLLIVGKRTNINAEILDSGVVTSGQKMQKHAVTFGSLFNADALDFFITNYVFPWQDFLPLAIGRRGYDNWVVSIARYWNYTVIDVTDSVLALHQTLLERGNFEGLHKPFNNYNLDMIASQDISIRYGLWGQTHCAEWQTWFDMCGRVALTQRKNIKSDCFMKKTFFQKLFNFREPL
ncbi:hypothetical protein CHS0354_038013 [Potamilus streckersoni]|uniref:Uncharacterized protein n=1 Tax=Potamilus streckersoni TaxID=2493646 RepID=A0AAE0TF90_9BIVA|nr:hypothetical protein CHS0354_038013 [Potamilus streckersoni]